MPMTVLGPMTNVVPAAVLLFVIVKLPKAGASRLPEAMLARLMVCLPVTPAATLIDCTLLRLTPELEVSM